MRYDIASKRLADLGARSLLRAFLKMEVEESHLIEELPRETVSLRSSDFPIRVRTREGEELIVLMEFQTWWEPDLPLRVGEYVLRFRRRYHLPVRPLVFLFKSSPSAVDEYDNGVVRVRYELVRMWEVEGRELLEMRDLYLLPLVGAARSEEEEIFEAERLIYESELEREVKADLLTILAIFSGLKSKDMVERLILRRRDIMIESAAYDIIKEEGFKEGLKKGLEEGALETARRMVLEVLQERFGVVPRSMMERVREIDNDGVLNVLIRQAVRCESLEEFREAMEKALS